MLLSLEQMWFILATQPFTLRRVSNEEDPLEAYATRLVRFSGFRAPVYVRTTIKRTKTKAFSFAAYRTSLFRLINFGS